MTGFQQVALLLAALWLLLVAVRFRRSAAVLAGGLIVIGLLTLAAFLLHRVAAVQLGLGPAGPWWRTPVFALAGLALMLACSPLADRIAGHWFPQPPSLEAFAPIRRSWVNLAAGILAAWVLGGVLEELVARGIVLQAVETGLRPWLAGPAAAGTAVCLAAAGAGLMHTYQGPRAVVVIAQLSVLFGVLFVVSGYDLWAVMLCHGLYDTIAFVRYAVGKSRYSQPDTDRASQE